MLLTSAESKSLDALLSWWESTGYAGQFFVILGCVGEFLAEFTEISTPEWRHRFSKLSLLVLIGGLAVELTARIAACSLFFLHISLRAACTVSNWKR